ATANASVTLPTQTGLTVAPTTFNLTVGATQQLTVTATYSNGSTQNVTNSGSTAYLSNNTAVVTVNATGLVTASGTGSTTVSASFGAFSASSTATVAAGTPGLGAAYGFSEGSGTTTADASGNNNTATLGTGASWSTAGKFGNAVSFNGTSGFLTVLDSNSLDLGATGTIEAWVNIAAGSRWHGIVAKGNTNSNPAMNYALEISNSNKVECTVGSGTNADIVDSTASVTVGSFTHIACTWDGTNVAAFVNGTQSGSKAQSLTPVANTSPLYIGQFGGGVDRTSGIIDEIRIYNRALTAAQIQTDMTIPVRNATQTGLTVTPVSFSLSTVGATQQLTVIATFSDGSTQNVTSNPSTTYLSNNTAVASVNATGLVQATGNGTTTVKATYGGFSASSTVTISLPTQSGLSVTPGSFSLTSVGGTQQLVVTAIFSDGSMVNVTNNSATTYLSNNTAVVTVGTTGLVTAVGNGSTTVKASYGGFSATANASVTLPTQTGLTVAPTTFNLTVGATQQLTVTATYSNGSTQNVTNSGSTAYLSNNTAVVTVNATGLVAASGTGSTTVSASFGAFSASSTVTVAQGSPGLVAAYNFDETMGSTANDLSGSG